MTKQNSFGQWAVWTIKNGKLFLPNSSRGKKISLCQHLAPAILHIDTSDFDPA